MSFNVFIPNLNSLKKELFLIDSCSFEARLNEGIAINPRRKDIIEKIKGKINIVPIEKLKDMAYDATGLPEKLDLSNETVGIIKWIDGSVLDIIKRVKC